MTGPSPPAKGTAHREGTAGIRRWVLGGAVLLVMPWLGCLAAPPEPLRIGGNVFPGYEPFYLARSLGYLTGTGVRLVEFTSASEVIRAVRNGAIEGAMLTLDEVLLLLERGADLRVVLVIDTSCGADVIIGQPSVSTLAQLRGKRVGAETTALGAYVLARALQKAGMTFTDVEVVPLEEFEHQRAFAEGRVDAVVTFEPVRTTLLSSGGRELFSSREIVGEIVDVLVIRQDYLAKKPEAATALLRAWFSALAQLQTVPADAAGRMSGRLGLAPAEVLASLAQLQLLGASENLKLLSGPNPPLLQIADTLSQVMIGQNLLTSRPRLQVDARPLQEATR